MKMRTARKAALVGGIATGALLFTGTAAQAADTEVDEAGNDAVQSTPEMLGGLPVPTDAVPGLNAVVPDQGLPLPLVDQLGDTKTDKDKPAAQPAGSPVDDLLGNLGGGLPVPLPF